MKGKVIKRVLACTIAAAMILGEMSQTGLFESVMTVQAADDVLNVTGSYTFDSSSTWDNNSGKENNIALTTTDIPAAGTTLQMDVLIPVTEQNESALDFAGQIKTVGILRVGDTWDWVQSNDIPALSASDFSEKVTIGGTEYYKASTEVVFGDTVGANTDDGWSSEVPFATAVTSAVAQVTLQFAGYNCDYAGDIAVANAALVNTEGSSGSTETALKTWDFTDGIGSWAYNSGWDYQYSGTDNTSVAAEDGKLKVNIDYSQDGDKSWSQLAIGEWGTLAVSGANKMTLDFYYDSSLLDGNFSMKTVIQYQDGETYPSAVEATTAIDTANAETVSGNIKKAKVTFNFDAISQTECCNIMLCLVGVNTTYTGAVWIDDLTLSQVTSAASFYVNSTKTPTGGSQALSVSDQKLNSQNEAGEAVATDIAQNITLVDANATDNTKAIYAYLEAVGDSDSVIFGHQNDTWHKAGSSSLSNSDTLDVTGSISGVVGIDALSLTGNEYSASRYNTEIGDQTFPETKAGNVAAAAALTNKNIADGAIITLSAHMPNFSIVKENADYNAATDPTYAKYDFSGYSPNTLTGDVMNKILPGGDYNDEFNAYLDMIADYASQVDGTILFRPFHENTGSWFWWGAAFCDASTYKNVYKYTVEYLRDEKNIHNILYVYGPGSEAANTTEYSERYPGDDYVDIVGFDMYHSAPADDDTWFTSFAQELSVVQQFAQEHHKLITVTETGVANSTDSGDNQTALHKSGNQHLDWYNEMLNAVSGSKASFFLLWANFGEKDGFYTPYVKSVNEDGTLYGHEELDYFIDFFNDARSVFAVNQKSLLAALTDSITVSASPTTTEATGYITAPVSGSRILDAATLTARITGTVQDVKFIFTGSNGITVELTATAAEGKMYSAQLTKAQLESLGEYVGTIALVADGKQLDTIKATFNIPEPEEDPYEIDGFENYYGVNSLLTKKWATNKATGNTISLTLTNEAGTYSDGNYGLKFSYSETPTGWAGATISKEVNWSDCNALQFWTIPDGNNQKVVIQLTANGVVYETYLNQYTEYTNSTKPMLVTIPFSKFVKRDTAGNPAGGLVSDCSSVTSFGLWVNAIAGSSAIDPETNMVSGTIYYDKITAVHTDVTEATFETAKSEQAAISVSGIPSTVKYGNTFTLKTAGGSGNGAVSYAVTKGSSFAKVEASTGKVTVTGVGTVEITVTKAGDSDYSSVSKTVSFTTVKAEQAAITIKGVGSTLSAEKTATLSIKGGSGNGAVTYAVTTGTKYAKVDSKSGKITVTGIGKVTITATKAADANYNKATGKITFTTKLPAKNTKLTVGSLKYQVTKSDSKKGTVTCYAPVSTKAASITIPATVKIGGVSFAVTAINKNAFKSNAKLKTVVIGNNVKEVGENAFYNCKSLAKVTIGSGVTKIGKKAFYGDGKLKSIVINSKKLTSVGASALKGIDKKAVIKVPSEKIKTYTKILSGKGQSNSVKIKK